MSKPHVILIAYYFPPGPEMGAVRPFRFHKYLRRMGYSCHVVTASPGADASAEEIYVVPDELRAVWEGSDKQRRSWRAYQELLVRKLMFPGHTGILWSCKAAAQCRQIVRRHPGKDFVLISTYPPLGTILAGLLVRLRVRIPWIADFRDPLGVGLGEFIPRRMKFWHRRLEWSAFHAANAIVANVEGAAAFWSKRYPWSQSKLHVIPNGFDPEDAPQAREIPVHPAKVIVHAGALYHGRNPEMVIASLSRLRAKGVPEALSARILLVGGLDAKVGLGGMLYQQAQQEGWLELRPPVPRQESQRLMAEADGLLLVQPQTDIQIPGKLFEYICIGRPVLALVPRSSAVEEVLQKSGVAHVCVYADEDAETADRKLVEFLRLPSSPAPINEWFRTNFNAQHQTEKLAEIIEQLAR